ncbi:MAG: PHB depolymerase family esterase [Oxalobacteraceae bacterium]
MRKNTMNINEHMIATMREATQALQDGYISGRGNGVAAATAAIQRALQKFMPDGASTANAAQNGVMHDINPPPQSYSRNADSANNFMTDLMDGLHLPSAPDASSFGIPGLRPHSVTDAEPEPLAAGHFITGSHTNHSGTRSYKLYIPTSYRGQSLPLVVMLHGCTQNPDDFAAGTRMNAIAEEKGCFVVYPSQAQSANNSKCWNWFNTLDQQRDQGEPSIIAGITRDIVKTYHIDARQIFIAGMSSGGAMSVIMATTYPDLYAAVGIHSGLPYASAQDLPSALAAMKRGVAASATSTASAASSASPHIKSVPIIVFHGDMDKTVHPRNGDQIIAQSLPADAASAAAQSATEQGKEPNGRAYKRTVHRDANGHAVAEHWVVHGSGHAWSGGSNRGSYTDPKGPDASREMMRFFSARGEAGTQADAPAGTPD